MHEKSYRFVVAVAQAVKIDPISDPKATMSSKSEWNRLKARS